MNMNKKENPKFVMPDWKTSLKILAIVVLLVLIISGRLTPKSINIFGLELEVNTLITSPDQAAQPTPDKLTATPTFAITATPTANLSEWSGLLSVRKPTLNEIRQEMSSIWDANNLSLGDMLSPDVRSLRGTAQQKKEYLWPIYWCAKDQETLAQNVENITTIFSVNDEVIPDKYIFNYDYDTNTGWKCNYHAAVIGGWLRNSQYTLRVERVFETDINDGQQKYPAGSYVYELSISVK
jgi:hypothetical protein